VKVRGSDPGRKLALSPATFPAMGFSQATRSATSHSACFLLGGNPPQDPAGKSQKFPRSSLLFSLSGPYTAVFDVFTVPESPRVS